MHKTRICYLVARCLMGLNLLMHGAVRLPKLEAWSTGTAEIFAHTFLPPRLVLLTAILIPCVETLVGICLVLGLFTRFGIVLGWLLIFTLMFGSSILEEWNNVFTQNLYGLYLVGLYVFLKRNYYSLDHLMKM